MQNKKKFLILSFILICACKSNFQKKLTIATSANMQFAMKEIKEEFIRKTGIECEVIVNSSGKLTAQIIEGAPFDILISADMEYPMELYTKGFTKSKPEIFAYGKIILWSLNENPSIELLTSDKINYIALANPKTAPYGKASVEILEHYGLLNLVEDKLVYGESISQTNRFITTNNAQIGFTAKSMALSPDLKKQGKWFEIDEKAYSPIAQGIVILKPQKEASKNAQKFYDFIFSETGKKILDKFGYSVPD